jgi:sporulation protein YlmC with PRC-barrel domain
MRLTELLGAEVMTSDGRKIGRVHDVRVRRRAGSSKTRADQQWRVVGLVVGEGGVLERLGLASARRVAPTLEHGVIPWDAVEHVDPRTKTIVVGASVDAM